jgi:hypothetical protein
MNEPSIIANILTSLVLFGIPSFFMLKRMWRGGEGTIRKFQDHEKNQGPGSAAASLELTHLVRGNAGGAVAAAITDEVLRKAPPRAVLSILTTLLIIVNIAIPIGLSLSKTTPREFPNLLIFYVAFAPYIFLLWQEKRKKINDQNIKKNSSQIVLVWLLSLLLIPLLSWIF